MHSRAIYEQRLVRRVEGWMQHQRMEGHQVYGPLLQHALAEWGTNVRYLALDTSTLWARYGLVRMALIYGGRALPIVWQVLPHPRSSVASGVYAD